jgi:DNA-binding PadR family transcriptional regulator
MPRQLLTDFELMLLLAILRVGDEAYGVQIAREIESTGGRRVVLGAAYAALDRLERNGLVSSAMGAPTSERGGRAKRFFRVTARGVRAVRATQQALVALWRDVPQLKLKERRT